MATVLTDAVVDKITTAALQHVSSASGGRTLSVASNLSIHREILPTGFVLTAPQLTLTVDRPSVLVFADHQPTMNWGHSCSYLLYTADGAQLYKEVPAMFPPQVYGSPSFTKFHVAVPLRPVHYPQLMAAFTAMVEQKAIISNNNPAPAGEGQKFAILYSGHSNNRHVNDLEFLYRALVDLFDFDPANIFVLNRDGTVSFEIDNSDTTVSYYQQTVQNSLSWPGDSSRYRLKVTGAGTQDGMDAAFASVKARIGANDLLFIHTNNHGSTDGAGSVICTHDTSKGYKGGFGSSSITAAHFAAQLKALPAYKQLFVMMEQCFAGGFNTPVINNSTATQTTIASAVDGNTSSDGGPDWDPFAVGWIAAVVGLNPDGSSLSVADPTTAGVITASEAFKYASNPSIKGVHDDPVFAEHPAGTGNTMNLGPHGVKAFHAAVGTSVSVSCADPNRLDVFCVASNHAISAAAWEQNAFSGAWRGWWPVVTGTAPAGSPISSVSRGNNQLDLFVTGDDGHIYTAAWDQAVDNLVGNWRGWWQIPGMQVAPGSPVSVVSRSPDRLDVFVADNSGQVWTAAWCQNVAAGKWQGWWKVPGVTTGGAKNVSAVSRGPNQIDIFTVATDGHIYTAAWDQNVSAGAWRGWWPIVSPGAAKPGTLVSCVARSQHQLDVFITGTDGHVYTAAWDQNVSNAAWRGWWPINGGASSVGGAVSVVSRSPDRLDVFTTGTDGRVYTAAWCQTVANGAWQGWWPIVNLTSTPGTFVGAVARSPHQLDVFVAGSDGRVRTAAWDQNVSAGAWRGAWQIG